MPKTSFRHFTFPKNIDQNLADLRSKPAAFWEVKSKQKVIELFQFVYKNTPAYQRFLKSHHIDGRKIKTLEDFKTLPIISKENYLRKANFIDLFPSRDVSKSKTISSTSGSTGEPFYFPRGEDEDAQFEYLAEIFLKNQFEIDKKTTLGVIGFGLGIWIGGIFTYRNFNKIACKGYPLVLAPAGNAAEIFLDVIKKFGRFFDQIILMGYAPFVKDIVDEGKDFGIDWKDYNLRVLTAAEGYSEKFKDYLVKKAGIKNPLFDFVNIYGTVELGTMANESPITNLIRKIAVQKKEVFKVLFPKANRLPTLVQYHPQIIYFEEVENEVIATGYGSSIPLIRYRFPDIGGVISYDDMVAKLKSVGVDIIEEAKKQKIDRRILRLPFVYIYDRADHALILRGANIYPEEIKTALHHKSLEDFVTGKFTMIKKEDRKMDEYLEVNVELKKKIRKNLKALSKVSEVISGYLLDNNSEFKDQYNSIKETVFPRIVLWPYQHEKYFKMKGKQKWVIKNHKNQ